MERLRNLKPVLGGSVKVIYAVPETDQKEPFSYTQRVIPVTCSDGITRIYSVNNRFLEKNPSFKELSILVNKNYYPCAICSEENKLAYTAFKFYPDKIDFTFAPHVQIGEFYFVGVEISWNSSSKQKRSYKCFDIHDLEYLPYCESLYTFIQTFTKAENALWVDSLGKLLDGGFRLAVGCSKRVDKSTIFKGL